MKIESVLEQLEQDQPHEGINQARELLDSDSLSSGEFSRLSYGLATGLFKIGSYHEALQWLDRTDSDRRWMLEGFCWMNLRNPSRAREAFLESAEQMSEHRVESLLLAAQALAQSGNLEEALRELKRLESRQSEGRVGQEIQFNLGLTHEELENFEDARHWFETVRDSAERFFTDESLFHLAVVHEELGQIDRALEYLDELEVRIEDDSELKEALERTKNRLSQQGKARTEQLRQYDF